MTVEPVIPGCARANPGTALPGMAVLSQRPAAAKPLGRKPRIWDGTGQLGGLFRLYPHTGISV